MGHQGSYGQGYMQPQVRGQHHVVLPMHGTE